MVSNPNRTESNMVRSKLLGYLNSAPNFPYAAHVFATPSHHTGGREGSQGDQAGRGRDPDPNNYADLTSYITSKFKVTAFINQHLLMSCKVIDISSVPFSLAPTPNNLQNYKDFFIACEDKQTQAQHVLWRNFVTS